jgi:hypothetical protein
MGGHEGAEVPTAFKIFMNLSHARAILYYIYVFMEHDTYSTTMLGRLRRMTCSSKHTNDFRSFNASLISM